jgi:Glycosyl hydrolases family 18
MTTQPIRVLAGGALAALAAMIVALSLASPKAAAADVAVAPYTDMTLPPPMDLAAASEATGVKTYSLGFVVHDPGSSNGCTPSWGGYDPIADGRYVDSIAAMRERGGDVIVSFGGADGQELAQTCTTSPTALAASYAKVIETFGLTSIDFDVEGTAAEDTDSIDLRSKAIAILEAAAAADGRPLTVSLTLQVVPSGLTPDALAVVQSAKDHLARIDVVNVMAMDYGDSDAPDPEGRMGAYAIQAAQSTHDQLRDIYPSKSDAELWAMVGATPMIGVNDETDEVFGLADARLLVGWANKQHVGRLAFWSANRDHPCPGGPKDSVDNNCSSIEQDDWAFSKIFASHKGGGGGGGTGTPSGGAAGGPRTVFAGRGLKLDRRGRVRFTLNGDPSEPAPYSGMLTMDTAKGVASKARKRRARLGSKGFTIAPGAQARVTLRLSARKRALVRRLGRLRVNVTIDAADPAGRRDVSSRLLTLRAAR